MCKIWTDFQVLPVTESHHPHSFHDFPFHLCLWCHHSSLIGYYCVYMCLRCFFSCFSFMFSVSIYPCCAWGSPPPCSQLKSEEVNQASSGLVYTVCSCFSCCHPCLPPFFSAVATTQTCSQGNVWNTDLLRKSSHMLSQCLPLSQQSELSPMNIVLSIYCWKIYEGKSITHSAPGRKGEKMESEPSVHFLYLNKFILDRQTVCLQI